MGTKPEDFLKESIKRLGCRLGRKGERKRSGRRRVGWSGMKWVLCIHAV